MNMYEVSLFLGFPVDKEVENLLKKNDQQLLALFIDNKGEHLHDAIYNHRRYLGKNAGQVSDLETLSLLETHIYSLLTKLIPDYDFQSKPLTLFPLETVDESK